MSLTPGPTSPEEALREAPSGRVSHSWVTFSFEGEARGETEPARPHDRYRLEAVNFLRGAPVISQRTGQTVLRAEWNGTRAPAAATGTLVGSPEPAPTTAADAELARRWTESRWRVALLVPFTLSPDWWRLARDERPPVHLSWTQGAPDSPIVSRALRTLYRARALPDAEWDYLAYLEMQPQDVAPIRGALAELRDPRRHPELAFVERSVELWMTKDLSVRRI